MERIPLLQAQVNALSLQLNQRTLESLEYRLLMKAVVDSHPDKSALRSSIIQQRDKLLRQGLIGSSIEGGDDYLDSYIEKWLALCND